jgi:signal transduction histidine kinase/ActR/RegA family two-component response regulator
VQTDATGHNPSARIKVGDWVSVEQVNLLYANLPLSQTVAAVNGAVLVLVQSSVIEPPQVIGWLACLAGVTLWRAIVGRRFARTDLSLEAVSRWRSYFLAGAAASGLVWGAAALLLYPPASLAHQVFLAFVLGGMVAGSVTLLTPVYGVFLIFAVCVLLPVTARFAVDAGEMHYAMALLGAIFLFAMLTIGKRIHGMIAQSLRLRFENRDLITYLQEEKQRVESANAGLLAAQDALRRANEALEARVAERTAALEEQDRRKDQFLAMLSHELRNPLAPMMNALYLLKATDREGAALPHAQGVIERQLRQLVRLVDDLLDVSRINQGRIELRRERVELADVVHSALETAQPAIDQHGHVVEVSLPEAPLCVSGDRVRLAQAVSNLLLNAVSYTTEPGRIALTLSRAGARAAISVKDSGIGIPPKLLPHVFDAFVRGDTHPAREQGGLGVGLALVRQLVELHKGEVTVFSAGKGRGSEFTIYLPLLSETESRPPSFPTPADERVERPRRVLVVDDNADAANTLRDILTILGHDVRCTYDGAAALAAARGFHPEIVLLDIGLPGMDGYEVARRLRADAAFRGTTLIALTGFGQVSDRLRAHEAGFDWHLTKPVDADALDEIIQGLPDRAAADSALR